MPTTALADVTDLGDWLGESITEDGDVRRAKWLLRRATSLVLETCGRVARPWTPADVPGGVQEIILSCAARAYVNPESWNYERLDDWMGGGKPVPEDGLYLTPTEKKSLLLYIEDAPTRGLGVIGTYREVWPPATNRYGDSGWINAIRGRP